MILSFDNAYAPDYNKYISAIKKLTKKTFKLLNRKDNFLIELNFVNNKTIKKINKNHRGINKETDVISFAFLERAKNEVEIKSNQPQFLGVIIISIDKIKSQAKEFEHSFKYELIYLYIHGLLHLLGYDHVHSKKEEKIMFDLEDKILEGEKL